MGKKVALVLVMVMLVNMVTWADDGTESEEADAGMVLAVLGVLFLIGVVVGGISLLSEADTPDDGVRLASMQAGTNISKTGFGSFLSLLNHIEVGQTQNGKIYTGLRFQF